MSAPGFLVSKAVVTAAGTATAKTVPEWMALVLNAPQLPLANASLATMPANTLKGNNTAGVATPVDIGLGNGLQFAAGTLQVLFGTTLNTVCQGNDSRITGALQTANALSELTATAATARTNLGLGTLATKSTIASADITDGTVTNADLATMAANTFKANNTGATGAPLDITVTQARTLLGLGGAALLNVGTAASTVAAGDDARILNADKRPDAQCRLVLASSTAIRLDPFDGNQVYINGTWFTIPSGGVSLASTGLTVGQFYFIYLFSSAGTLTLEASTTTPAQNTTTGQRQKTADATRLLVGAVVVGSGTLFYDQADIRWVYSWFNKRPRKLECAPWTASTSSTTDVELTTAARVQWISFKGEAVSLHVTGYRNPNVQSFNYTYVAVDGTIVSTNAVADSNAGFINGSVSADYESSVDTNHYATAFGHCSTGTTAFGGVTHGIVWQ